MRVAGLATEMRRVEESLDGYRDAMNCHLGDFVEYAALRESLSRREKDINRQAAAERREAAEESWLALRQGDVFLIPAGRRAGPAVVLDHRRQRAPARRLRPMVLTADGQVRRMSVADTSQPVEPFTRIAVPKGFVAKDDRARRELLASLQAAVAEVPHDQRNRRAASDEDARSRRCGRAAPPPLPRLLRPRGARTLGRALPPHRATRCATSSGASRVARTRSPDASIACARCSPSSAT